jgi:hypothetical protein
MSRSSGFAIEVSPDAELLSEDVEAFGVITVREFCESFRMDLSFWSVNEYRRSWRRALRRVDSYEVVDSCLISSITDPAFANWISCWPLYRRGEDVFVQNSLILLGELDGAFNAKEPWLSINPHRTVNEDGDRISEWATNISEVRKFMQSDHLAL